MSLAGNVAMSIPVLDSPEMLSKFNFVDLSSPPSHPSIGAASSLKQPVEMLEHGHSSSQSRKSETLEQPVSKRLCLSPTPVRRACDSPKQADGLALSAPSPPGSICDGASSPPRSSPEPEGDGKPDEALVCKGVRLRGNEGGFVVLLSDD